MKLKPRILVAVAVGLVMVSGALVFSKTPSGNAELTTATVVEATLDRTYIEVFDNNQDSIPDWQEVFADGVVSLDGISSTTAFVPDTETGELIVGLAETLMNARATNDPLFSSEQLLQDTTKRLNQQSLDEAYTREDINISTDSSELALHNYSNGVARIILEHPLPDETRNELEILKSALESDDKVVLLELEPIIAVYEGMLNEMLIVSVPDTMVAEHLALTNVYRAILEDLRAFAKVFEDALPAMLRFRRYPADANALYTAITNLYLKLDDAGIQWNQSDPVLRLIQFD